MCANGECRTPPHSDLPSTPSELCGKNSISVLPSFKIGYGSIDEGTECHSEDDIPEESANPSIDHRNVDEDDRHTNKNQGNNIDQPNSTKNTSSDSDISELCDQLANSFSHSPSTMYTSPSNIEKGQRIEYLKNMMSVLRLRLIHTLGNPQVYINTGGIQHVKIMVNKQPSISQE